MVKNTLFIITSVIHATTNRLSYIRVRSVYSAEERAKQTLDTIQSIRTKVPEAKILLIELGLKRDLPYNIEGSVDKYLYLGHKKKVRDAVDSPYKGLGEVVGLYLANRWIDSFDADYYFKISGRYFLNDEFDIHNWIGNGYTGRANRGNFTTVLYGFPKRLYTNWRHALKQSIPALLRGEALESALPRGFEKPITSLEKIGASGLAGATGKFKSV